MRCSQCTRKAVAQIGTGDYLCVDHYAAFANAINMQQQHNMAMINFYRDQINEVFGLPPSTARIHVPQPTINHTPVTYNNISVDRSVVGSINTAQVGRIDVAMERIKQTNSDSEVNEAIKALTEAVLKSSEIEDQREEIVEQLAFLAEQAALPKDQRQSSVISMVLKSTATTIGAAAGLTTLWNTWGNVLTQFFAQ